MLDDERAANSSAGEGKIHWGRVSVLVAIGLAAVAVGLVVTLTWDNESARYGASIAASLGVTIVLAGFVFACERWISERAERAVRRWTGIDPRIIEFGRQIRADNVATLGKLGPQLYGVYEIVGTSPSSAVAYVMADISTETREVIRKFGALLGVTIDFRFGEETWMAYRLGDVK